MKDLIEFFDDGIELTEEEEKAYFKESEDVLDYLGDLTQQDIQKQASPHIFN